MTEKTPLYVAETNEARQIECVWCSGLDRKAARPIRSPKRHLKLLQTARFSGASSAAIYEWLKQQADNTSLG